MRNKSLTRLLLLIICIFSFTIVGSFSPVAIKAQDEEATVGGEVESRKPYGVFLSIDESQMSKLKGYDVVVIDAQYFSSASIKKLHDDGQKVYSYLNIGSLENFRWYYKKYRYLSLGRYENWSEEVWMNVSSVRWQKFVVNTLARSLIKKGVDGFFIDNCDVYYNYPKRKIFNGLTIILRQLRRTGKKVIINGGDTYVNQYYRKYRRYKDILTGINQESVFSSIDFDNDKLITQNSEDSKYYQNYIGKYGKLGADIYVIEYTTDSKIIEQINNYCNTNNCKYYVSDSIELD